MCATHLAGDTQPVAGHAPMEASVDQNGLTVGGTDDPFAVVACLLVSLRLNTSFSTRSFSLFLFLSPSNWESGWLPRRGSYKRSEAEQRAERCPVVGVCLTPQTFSKAWLYLTHLDTRSSKYAHCWLALAHAHCAVFRMQLAYWQLAPR